MDNSRYVYVFTICIIIKEHLHRAIANTNAIAMPFLLRQKLILYYAESDIATHLV